MHMQVSQAITHWLGEQQEAMVQLLADLVNIDSGSYDKAGVDAVAVITALFGADDVARRAREFQSLFARIESP